MKRFEFNIDARFAGEVFKPIRSKAHSLTVLMKCTKRMLLGNIVPNHQKVGELVLIVSKTSRIFLFSEEKYFSLVFPFSVKSRQQELYFSTTHIEDVNSKVTSDVLGVLASSRQFEGCGLLDFAEAVEEFEEAEPAFWPFFLALLMHEDGYVRYDYDPINEDGDLHPLHHYDFFYSSSAACKLGLRKRLVGADLVDFLLPETACHFIESGKR